MGPGYKWVGLIAVRKFAAEIALVPMFLIAGVHALTSLNIRESHWHSSVELNLQQALFKAIEEFETIQIPCNL